MNYLDLFSGIGGFHLGLEQAGFKFDWVGFSEIDKYATQIYRKRFPDAEELGSIVNIRPESLPEINLVTFGFPCQDLSVAGKRKGFSGKRSVLFFEAMRIIEYTKPDIFIFENVKGLFSSNEGRDFEAVLRTVADIGIYECEWQLCNTRWFLPQHRERIMFVGHLRGRSRPKVFPFRESDFKFKKSHGKPRSRIIDPNYLQRDCRIYEEIAPTINARNYKEPPIVNTGHACGNYKGMNMIECGETQITVRPVLTPDRHKKRQNGRRFKDYGEPSFTLTGQDRHGVEVAQCIKKETKIRRITPKESERLQGFPDGWTDGLSDTQKYKCLGNAVSIPVVKAIGERLL